MFTRFTGPDGLGAWVRASGVRAITEQEDGGARLFLGYGLQTDVRETPEEVIAALMDAGREGSPHEDGGWVREAA